MLSDRKVLRRRAKPRAVGICTHCEDGPLFLWYLPPTLGRQLAALRRELADRSDDALLGAVDGCGECQGFTLGREPRNLTEH